MKTGMVMSFLAVSTVNHRSHLTRILVDFLSAAIEAEYFF